jgi:hypothetical protein
VETVFERLLLLNNNIKSFKENMIKQSFRYCGDIDKIRYLGNLHFQTLSHFYEQAISSSQGGSEYSWETLFKMINIHNVEDLRNFYLKNLKA